MTLILAFLFVIGVLVFIHELGHFLVAKWSGVKVEKFSLGFGKKLIGFRRGETEYLISMLPLGGYVKMFGEGGEGHFIIDKVEPGSRADKAGFKSGDKIVGIDGIKLTSYATWQELKSALRREPEKEYTFTVERSEDRLKVKDSVESLNGAAVFSEKEYPRSFSNQSIGERLAIVVAGPFMNLAFPFLLIPLVFMLGISIPAYLEEPPVVGYIESNSSASEAGFQIGDKIIEIEGDKVETWRDVNIAVQSNPDSVLDVKVRRDGDIKTLQLKASSTSEGIVEVGLGQPLPAEVGDVVDGTPADQSGLKKGDKILSIDGVEIKDWYSMASVIKKKANQEITLTVERDGNQRQIEITPEPLQQEGQGAIGIVPHRDEILKKYGFFESIFQGIKEAAKLIVEITVLLFSFLYRLITGEIPLSTAGKSIAGPLLIAKVSASAAESGLAQLLQFTAFISINLGLINLFPIPVLDGGHIMYLTIESVKGRPLSQRALEISQRIGFTLLLFIMFLAIYNDIVRLKGSILESLGKLLGAFN